MKIMSPILFGLVMLIASCTSTKAVQEFSTASRQSLELYESLPYSFSQNCRENCIQERIRDLSFKADDCDCAAANTADSVTLVIFKQLDWYLGGLTALSGKEIGYKTAALGTALSEGKFGPLTVGKDDAAAFSKLSATILDALAGKYRKRKLREYVTAANEPFQKLVGLLEFNVGQNLTALLNNQKLLFRSNYLSISRDTALTAYEKRRLMEDYFEHVAQLEQHQRSLQAYSRALQKIQQGHGKLAENISRLNDTEVQQILVSAAADIRLLISQFNAITK